MYGYAVSQRITKFVDALPLFGAAGGPSILTANKTRYPGTDYYEIVAGAFRSRLSSGLPVAGSRQYGYAADPGAGSTPAYTPLGGVIIARRDTPVRIKYRSDLPPRHIIPFDATLPTAPGMLGGSEDRTAIHLHGGLVPWASDGGPFHWIDPAGAAGTSNVPWLADDAGILTRDLYYPNRQSSRMMWYHDHAIGTTRTSAYAGLATGYIITDAADDAVNALYPLAIDATTRTFILVFQDKVFYNPAIDPGFRSVSGPSTLGGAVAGDLWYPYIYEKAIWKYQGNAKAAPPVSCIPEMFGDTMMVNGRVFPTANVNRRGYRLRTLNACNARFLNLKFVVADATGKEPSGGYAAPRVAPVNAWMIGTEGGFLPAPVQIFSNGMPTNARNLIPWLQAPAERSDMIVDFSQCPAGMKVLLFNDAPAPYPVGAPIFDWYPGAPNPGAAAIVAGSGPNTRTIMQFVVRPGAAQTATLPSLAGANPALPTVADPVNGGLMPAGTQFAGYVVNPIAKEITLSETFDGYGRLEQRIGTNVAVGKGQFGVPYLATATETVQYGTIEIWNVYNLTADVHPMHFHLFNAKVLRRRLFRNYNGLPTWAGPGRGPDPGEEGWKETIKVWPGECCTIAALIEDPLPSGSVTVPQAPVAGVAVPPVTSILPTSPRTGGHEYVYHCHILEHEEHDMMRPLVAV